MKRIFLIEAHSQGDVFEEDEMRPSNTFKKKKKLIRNEFPTFSIAHVGNGPMRTKKRTIAAQTTVAAAITCFLSATTIQGQDACSDSPFGQRLEVGSEKEIYLGGVYSGVRVGQASQVSWRSLDLDPSGNLKNYPTGRSSNIIGSTPFLSTHIGATGDLNGDGYDEFIQGWQIEGNQQSLSPTPFQLATTNFGRTGSPTDQSWHTHYQISQAQIAVGHIDGSISTADTTQGNPIDSIVLGGLGVSDNPSIWVLFGNQQGNIAAFPGNSHGAWNSFDAPFIDIDIFKLDVGDVDSSGSDDIAMALLKEGQMSLTILAWDEDFSISTTTAYANKLDTLATKRFSIGQNPARVELALADIDGDFRKEIIVATAVANNDDPARNEDIIVRSFNVNGEPGDLRIDEGHSWTLSSWVEDGTRGLAMSTGDFDRDHLEEIALGYYNGNTRHWELLTIGVVPDEPSDTSRPPSSMLQLHGHFNKGSQRIPDAHVGNIRLESEDLDRDGKADILISFTDRANHFWVHRLEQRDMGSGILLQPIGEAYRSTDGPFHHSPTLAIGDRDNDSIYADYSNSSLGVSCLRSDSDVLSAVAFVPPYWKTLQGDLAKSAYIGQSKDTSSTEATGLTRSTSRDVSGYVSLGGSGEVLGVGIAATATASAGHEESQSSTRGTSLTTSEGVANGASTEDGDEAIVVFERISSRCFNYRLDAENADVGGALRFCDTDAPKNERASLDGWTRSRGPGRSVHGAGASWVPIVRDWASLALFRDEFVSQSSVHPTGGSPALAVNGDVNGHVDGGAITDKLRLPLYYSRTKKETQPWWQVDLGRQYPIRHVRLWNRIDSKEDHLSDFWVMVSQVPFGDRELDSILADPNVEAFRFSGGSLRVADIPTVRRKNDTIGQYVRIQLASAGVLSLAEVQVFGRPHSDPDRYPIDFRENDVEEGFHEVRVYNPYAKRFQWIDERGTILWDGRSTNILKNELISNSGGSSFWSRQTATEKATFKETTIGSSARFGAALDITAETDILGFTTSVGGGVGVEFSSAFDGSESSELSWSESLEFGGSVANFQGSEFKHCEYSAIPYSYAVTDRSGLGFTQNYMVLDYIVPNDVLDRSEWERYESCRDNSAPETNIPIRLNSTDFTFDPSDARTSVLKGGASQREIDLIDDIVATGPLPDLGRGDAPSGLPSDHYFSFDGSQSVMVKRTDVNVGRIDNGYTVEAWIRLPKNDPNAGGYVFAANDPYPIFGYDLRIDASGRLFTSLLSRDAISADGAFPVDGQWHHLASVADVQSQTLTYFVDGQLKETLPFRERNTVALEIWTRSLPDLFYFIGGNWGLKSRITGASKDLKIIGQFKGDIDRVRTSPVSLRPWQLDNDPDGRGITLLSYDGLDAPNLEAFYPTPRGKGTFPERVLSPRATTLESFEIRSNRQGISGSILTGYVKAPESGDYRFMIRSNREAELFLNRNGENPIAAQRIADSKSNQGFSNRIYLTEGERYYIEATMLATSSTDSLSVAWQRPGTSRPDNSSPAIYGRYLHPLGAIRHALRTPPSPEEANLNPDNDGLSNQEEFELGTDPNNDDTDGDGLKDSVETNTGVYISPLDTGTDPLREDTDGDRIIDKEETADGIYFAWERTGTNPHKVDSDGDDFDDGIERQSSTDPNDPTDFPDAGSRRNNFFATTPAWIDPAPTGNPTEIADPSLIAFWNFDDNSNPDGATDSISNLYGQFEGATFSENAAGFSGLIGDRALDLRRDESPRLMRVTNSFLNDAAEVNQITIVVRQKLDQISNATTFHGVSNTSTGGGRGLSAHIPWSTREIFFDTAGCCSPEESRLQGSIDSLDDAHYDPKEWHTYTLIKNGDKKSIWIDDKLFLEGSNTAPLPDDFSEFVLGSFANGANPVNGVIDDVAIFKRALTESEIASIADGTSPLDLLKQSSPIAPNTPNPTPPAESDGLLAYWDFNDSSQPEISLDSVEGLSGLLEGGAAYSANGLGFSGIANDRALDLGDDQSGQLMRVPGNFLNKTASSNQATIVIRQKLDSIADATMFYGISNSSSGESRGISAHIPWGNSIIYFDSGGCCDPEAHRISESIDSFEDPEFRFTDWHTYTFIKQGDTKTIWIDDRLFLEGTNTAPLPDDFSELIIGANGTGAESVIGMVDDFAIFDRALTEPEIRAIVSGIAPNALGASPPPSTPGEPTSPDPITVVVPPTTSLALTFDGERDFVKIDQGLIPSSGDFSIELWYRTDSTALGSFRELLSQAHVTRSPRFYLGITPEGVLRAGDAWIDTGIMLPMDNQWHHLALVRSQSNAHIFIDGFEQKSRGSVLPNPSAEPEMIIGRQFNGGEFWKGEIDELRIWSEALSADAINHRKDHLLNGTEAHLIAYYPFKEGTGSTRTDNAAAGSSPTSIGTLVGNPLWVTGPALKLPQENPLPPGAVPPVVELPAPKPDLPSSSAECPITGSGSLVNFSNPQGQVIDQEGNPAGPDVIGQIWAGPTRSSLKPVCSPISVFGFGFFVGGSVELPFAGTSAFIQLRAWSGAPDRLAADYIGESPIVQMSLNAPGTLLPPPSLQTEGFQLEEASQHQEPVAELPALVDPELSISIDNSGGLRVEWIDSVRLQLQASSHPGGPWLPVLTPNAIPGNRSPLTVDMNAGPATLNVPGQEPIGGNSVFFRLVDLFANQE